MKGYINTITVDKSLSINSNKKFPMLCLSHFKSIAFRSFIIASLSLTTLAFQNCAKKGTSNNVGEATPASSASSSSSNNSNGGTDSSTSQNYLNSNASGSNTGVTTTVNTGVTNNTNTSNTANTNTGSTTNTNTGSTVNTGDNTNTTNATSGTTASPAYSISVAHRYYNSASIDYIFSLDKISATQIPNGYSYQGTGFYVYDRNSFSIADLAAKKMLQLRACLYSGSKPYHFTEVSKSSNFKCNDLGTGFSDEGLYGYLSQQQLPNSAPLYRCYWTGLTHLTTPNINECVKSLSENSSSFKSNDC